MIAPSGERSSWLIIASKSARKSGAERPATLEEYVSA
jgi:hypothetical protein